MPSISDVTTEGEIRLHKRLSRGERFVQAIFADVVLLFGVGGLATWALTGQAQGIGTLAALVVGTLVLCHAGFSADVLWTITPDGIAIEKKRPFGRPSDRFVRRADISGIHVDRDSASATDFRLSLRLISGDCLTSPPFTDITHVQRTTASIAELLGVADIVLPPNPLDAANAEIHLGQPVRPASGHAIRIVTLIIASLCTIPYAYKFWNDLALATGEIIFLIAGPIVAFLFFRYAYRLAGTFWVVGHDEIRVERLLLDGKPHVDLIAGRDIRAIHIQPGRSDDGSYLVEINLVGGRKLRSPDVGTQDKARAVATEIALRLGVAPERVHP